MSQQEAQAYIGLCRFERAFDEEGKALEAAEGQTLETFEAACWSASASQYDGMLAHLLPDQGYRLLRTEEVMPAQTWFEMKGFNQALADLAAKVHNGHRVQIGSLSPVAFEQTHGLQGSTASGNEQGPLIITEHPITPLPDQSKIWPPSDRQWISDDLKQLLFGQELPEEHQHILEAEGEQDGASEDQDASTDGNGSTKQPLLRTYFITDATLRKKITKVFDLNMEFPKRPVGANWIEGENGNRGNIEIRSLFKGQAQEELKEVAPYLCDLTLPDGAYDDSAYVPEFHKALFKSSLETAFKDKNEEITHLDTGIFIRTAADFDSVWKHFRKFTRIQDENRKWYYWRFWSNLTSDNFKIPLLNVIRKKMIICHYRYHELTIYSTRIASGKMHSLINEVEKKAIVKIINDFIDKYKLSSNSEEVVGILEKYFSDIKIDFRIYKKICLIILVINEYKMSKESIIKFARVCGSENQAEMIISINSLYGRSIFGLTQNINPIHLP